MLLKTQRLVSRQGEAHRSCLIVSIEDLPAGKKKPALLESWFSLSSDTLACRRTRCLHVAEEIAVRAQHHHVLITFEAILVSAQATNERVEIRVLAERVGK